MVPIVRSPAEVLDRHEPMFANGHSPEPPINHSMADRNSPSGFICHQAPPPCVSFHSSFPVIVPGVLSDFFLQISPPTFSEPSPSQSYRLPNERLRPRGIGLFLTQSSFHFRHHRQRLFLERSIDSPLHLRHLCSPPRCRFSCTPTLLLELRNSSRRNVSRP